GLDLDCPLLLDSNELMPSLKGMPEPQREQIVALAVARRSEVIQAAAGLEVTSLEVIAQKKILGLRGDTFASGSDIHADPVPQGFANGEYRPGAITIE